MFYELVCSSMFYLAAVIISYAAPVLSRKLSDDGLYLVWPLVAIECRHRVTNYGAMTFCNLIFVPVADQLSELHLLTSDKWAELVNGANLVSLGMLSDKYGCHLLSRY